MDKRRRNEPTNKSMRTKSTKEEIGGTFLSGKIRYLNGGKRKRGGKERDERNLPTCTL